MLSSEQLSDDDVGTAVVMASFHQIHRGHVLAYTDYAFNAPVDLSDKARREATEAILAFANLGWATFHAMNKGRPFKEKPKKTRKKAGEKPQKPKAKKESKGK